MNLINLDPNHNIFIFTELAESGSNEGYSYSDPDRRLQSLEGFPHAFELSTVGGYVDEDKKDCHVSCFKCDLGLPWQEIHQLSETLGVTFLKAAWIFHAESNPCCDFLKDKRGK